jgi:SAM-dependent methyltransferase
LNIKNAILKPFQTIRSIVAYQLQPPPMEEFTGYDEYWTRRGTSSLIYRRWEVAADAMEDGCSVLDVGCGSGGFLAYLKKRRPHMRAVGCDISPVAVERAKQAGFEAYVHDIGTTPLSETYDYITCFDVIEHTPYSERAFRSIKGNFRKTLFVSVPNIGCLRCRVRLAVFGKFPLTVCLMHVNEHFRHWTISDFSYWMKRESMRIVRIDGQYGLRGFYRWFPGLFAHGVIYTLQRQEDGRPAPSAPPAQ